MSCHRTRLRFTKWYRADLRVTVATQEEPPEPQPFVREPQPEPAPKPKEPEVDWTHGKAVFISRKVLKGRIGTVAGFFSGMGSKAIRRTILDGTDGKIDFESVLERTKPARFKAVVEASGFDPDPAGFILLWKKQDLGMKGLIVRTFERMLPEKIRGKVPIEVIFERAHREDFESVETALKVMEPQSKGEPDKPKETGFDVAAFFKDPKTYMLSLLGGLAADRLEFRVAEFLARRRKRKVAEA